MGFSRQTLHVSFEMEKYNELQKVAEADNRKMTDYVRIAVDEKLKRDKIKK